MRLVVIDFDAFAVEMHVAEQVPRFRIAGLGELQEALVGGVRPVLQVAGRAILRGGGETPCQQPGRGQQRGDRHRWRK